MLTILKSLWLGVTLIILASALLLYSDRDRRRTKPNSAPAAAKTLPRLAVMQWVSTDLLDNTVSGMVEGLRRQGFEAGRTAEIRFLNASGDNTTGNVMARELVGGGYDLVLTASTLALQTVAKANTQARVRHVFGGVTDPYGAGVGITGPASNQHPAHLVGVGTFQPVERAIRLARQMNPSLRRIGVVWSPGESNSEACVGKARAVCKELGIELLEANASSTVEVPEAVRSVLTRNAEAIWVGGDTVAISSLGAIVSAARAAKIPVFTNDPVDTSHGALFGVGASYRDVGIVVGEIAGNILKGADPRSFGVENLAPELLSLNETLAAELGQPWSIPDTVRAQAKAKSQPPSPAASTANSGLARQPEPGRTYRVGALFFSPHPVFETALEGIRASLREAGFVEGRNLELRPTHPNADMSLLPQTARQLADGNFDVLVPLSTPCLQAIVAAPRKAPVVFGVVSSPVEAGAGKTFAEHLPDVTGAVWTAPSPGLFRWLKEQLPNCRKVGLLYNPSDANSMREKETARALLAGHGMSLVERTVNSSSDIAEAIQSLLAARVDAVFGMGDNTVASGYAGLVQACRKARVPLLADDDSLMGTGALFTCGASPQLEGRAAGRLIARVLLGESPAGIPFAPSAQSHTTVDFAAAAALGLTLPVGLLKESVFFHHPSARVGRPFRIVLVNLVSNPVLDSAEQGVVRGLKESGFLEKTDFTLKRLNAQGEISQLTALLEAARAESPDLIVTVTTPALMAAAKSVKDIPVVFTVASDPVVLGLFKPGQAPANLTGVHDDPPVDRLLDMARKHDPALTAVGILYDPAQPNSLISVEKLRRACRERSVTLHEVTANSVSDLPAATLAVMQRGAGAILLSADNLVTTGFPAIEAAAKKAGVPIFATDPALVRQGATGAIGDDFEAWGAQSGRLAAKVLAGVSPRELPIERTQTQEVIEPAGSAAAAKPTSQAPARPWELRIARYNEAQTSTDTYDGIMDGLEKQGLKEGRDFNYRCLNAQGDLTTLTSIMTEIRASEPDLVLAISTPTLQAALRQLGNLRVIFGSVADGVQAGAGKSETDHLPNVTGITSRSPFPEMARLIRASVPEVRKVGTLFSPAEINSELYRGWFAEALKAEGLELVAVPVNSSADTAESATELLRSPIQLVCQIADNTVRPGFAQLVVRTREAGLPFFCFDGSGMRDGAALALARDYYNTGLEVAELAVRVLRGAETKDIPFVNTRTETLTINPELLAKYGIVLSPEMKARTKVMTGAKP